MHWLGRKRRGDWSVYPSLTPHSPDFGVALVPPSLLPRERNFWKGRTHPSLVPFSFLGKERGKRNSPFLLRSHARPALIAKKRRLRSPNREVPHAAKGPIGDEWEKAHGHGPNMNTHDEGGEEIRPLDANERAKFPYFVIAQRRRAVIIERETAIAAAFSPLSSPSLSLPHRNRS